MTSHELLTRVKFKRLLSICLGEEEYFLEDFPKEWSDYSLDIVAINEHNYEWVTIYSQED